jgi:multidrug resistance efflux pump
MKKHWWKLLLAVLAVVAVGGMLAWTPDAETQDLLVQPKVGPFQLTVTTTGELKAKNSVSIYGPSNARQARIYEMKILRLIPEGSVVKKGEFVAELDRSELQSQIKDVELELQKTQSQHEQAQLDSSLTLSKARDEQINLRYAMEEARLKKEQAKFEPPSVQRQAEIDFEKSERALKQAIDNYQTQVAQASAKVREAEAELLKNQKRHQELLALSGEFTIMAPENGMLVYKRDWRGQRVTEGGTVNAWDPVVATLPDLSVMESITFVNEVDIQKIRVGQPVQIGLDADADKKLTGSVTRVANIGE